jgi:hypothetical protein
MSYPKAGTFMIVCRDDTQPDGTKGKFVLATRRTFKDMFKALKYGQSISPAREPKVLVVLDSVEAMAEKYQEALDRMEYPYPDPEPDPEPADVDPLFGKPLT